MSLNRSIAPERLGTSRARILQRCDPTFRPGSLIGGYGAARTQISPSTNTVTSCFVARMPSGQAVALDSASGSIRMTPGNNTLQGSGPLNEWVDARVPLT